ncbi:hypothetical protein [Deinococcus sp. Leaf326]|uniref:hypothetical protein n=1 Tax=Deinococcus sp. Leaf326 TaxID=1736338 RepID=UPI0006F89361|nr:hypothetical protein [Deinococcus sp. Leaf326]KQR25712.1 hypothetical protein ASF71_18685 [Deinococcus sp. Leaf326]
MQTLATDGDTPHALSTYFEKRKQPESHIAALEINGDVAYLAVTRQGLTQAFVVELSVLPTRPFGHDLALGPVQREQQGPTPCEVSPAFLKHLSPLSPMFTTPEGEAWRTRATAHAQRQARNQKGDVLLGTYGSARGCISYDEEAKNAFKADSLRYLKRLAKALGYPVAEGRPRAVTWNAGGIALHLQVDTGLIVMVEIFASGTSGRVSPSGTAIMWRFENSTGKDNRYPHPNQWPLWSLSVPELAQTIQREAGHFLAWRAARSVPLQPLAAAS